MTAPIKFESTHKVFRKNLIYIIHYARARQSHRKL